MNIRISTKGKRPLRSLTPSDKVHAIQRIHDGESKASVARDIGVPESTLRGWCKNEDKLRFMSRQSAAEKIGGDSLSDKLNPGSNVLGGPPEKRQRLDNSLALNFSNKLKFDELNSYKAAAQMNGLDFCANKTLTDLSNFNSLANEYGDFNGVVKNKMYGADIARQRDPSMAAISPLSSLTHLSGLTGLNQSPLAISFNELTTNLTLLAQLNPGLSGLNGLAASGNILRNHNAKTKPSQAHSPRSEPSERHGGLTVKNWAKQNSSTPSSNDSTSCGLNLCQNETNHQMKSPNRPITTPSQMGATMQSLSSLPDDPLLYWLKSQQAMLGISNIYNTPPLGIPSPPMRSSTPQPQNMNINTPPIIPNTLTPSSTPSGSLDDKNAAWFNWCKAFGASLNSLNPATVVSVLQGGAAGQHPAQTAANSIESYCSADKQMALKNGFENILYSQLTKDSSLNLSPQNSLLLEQAVAEAGAQNLNRPEDLSAKSSKSKSPSSSPNPSQSHSPNGGDDELQLKDINSASNSTIEAHGTTKDSKHFEGGLNSLVDCRDVLDNLLYKINNSSKDPARSNHSNSSLANAKTIDDCSHNNNNNSNKTDEEEWIKGGTDDEEGTNMDEGCRTAIEHGEKFLQWLENCSNPRVTAVQLMQLRFLISSVKEVAEPTSNASEAKYNPTAAIEIDDSSEDGNRSKTRRRK